MRRTIMVTAMVLTAAGCVSTPPPASAPSQGYRPLDAYIMPPTGGLRFHVSRPAYVAMFEIIPGQGTQLLYPAPGHGRLDGYIYAGDRVVRSRGFRDSHYYLTGGSRGMGAVGEPRFIFLIASERPLRLEQFGPGGYGLRQAMDFRTYSSPYAAMEGLAELTLPSMIDDGSWTTDFYVFWPQVLHDRRGSRDVLVRCNGYEMLVPYQFVSRVQREICGRRAEEAPQGPRPADPGPDSTDIEQPDRRAPIPAATEPGRERIVSSRQLQQPRSSRPESRPLDAGRISIDGEDDAGRRAHEQPERGREGRKGGAAAVPGRGGRASDPGKPANPASPADPPRARPATPAVPASRETPGAPAEPARPAVPVSRGSHAKPEQGRPPRATPPPAAPASRPDPSPAPAPARPVSPPPSRPAPEPAPAPAPRPEKKCDPCAVR
jgi:hypothetical protein